MKKVYAPKWLICLVFGSILLLGACQKEKEDIPQPLEEALEQLKDSGEIFKITHLNDLTGIDQNKNGIRDDIDQYIAGLEITKSQQQTVKQSARAFEDILKADLNNQKVMTQAQHDLNQAIKNMSTEFTQPHIEQQILSSLEQQILNTPERQKKYQQYRMMSMKEH